MIRFFCPVVPGPAGDAGYEALVALSARFPGLADVRERMLDELAELLEDVEADAEA